MTVQNPQLVTWLVLIILTLVFLQGVAIAVSIFMLGRKLAGLKGMAGKSTGQLLNLLGHVDHLLETAEKVHDRLPEHLEKVNRSLKWATRKIEEVDSYAGDNLERISGNLDKVNEKVDRVLSGFGLATYKVHAAIIHPTRHLAAALSAIQESVVWLLTRGRRDKSRLAYQDEQNFI